MPKEDIKTEDAMIKSSKKGVKNFFKTAIIVIILVLIADMCILLGLNRIGVIDINNQIDNIPVINNFVNHKVKEEVEQDKVLDLSIEVEALQKQLQLAEADITILKSENEKLIKENKTLEEEVLKLQSASRDMENLTDYYSKMKPKQAAEALNYIDASIIAEIFAGMKESNVASILDKMDPSKVAEVTKLYKNKK